MSATNRVRDLPYVLFSNVCLFVNAVSIFLCYLASIPAHLLDTFAATVQQGLVRETDEDRGGFIYGDVRVRHERG